MICQLGMLWAANNRKPNIETRKMFIVFLRSLRAKGSGVFKWLSNIKSHELASLQFSFLSVIFKPQSGQRVKCDFLT